ncbi:MAG: M48 family metallopeptidase [Desulfosalsimonadaceae bacterium]|nr:M48 family metallopeptidase [Desulfosalsimonadaceae bacterium]
MNFFEHQEESRKKTVQLVFLMIIAVFTIIGCVYAAVMAVFYTQDIKTAAWFDPSVFSAVALAVLTLVIGGSIVKLIALRRGGDYVAESMGGRPLHPETKDPKEKQLMNVIDEMALASGIAAPTAYVLDQEQGMNAFAAGDNPTNAVVAVTRGCLNQLSRDELQGVVAHEFSHILNGDMRLNLRLIGMISGIMVLASAGRIVLRSTGRSRKNNGPILMLGLLLLIIGYAGVFVSRIIQSAVSRQREFLADASAVQFTRNPSGIAGALKKIGGFSKGSIVHAPAAQEASHLFFSSAIATLFATHPPLPERIRRIDPGFSGEFAAIPETVAPFADETPMAAGFSDAPQAMRMDPGQVTESVGIINPDQMRYGAMLLQAIPAAIRRELSDPMGASSVVLALLFSSDDHEKKLQTEGIRQLFPEERTSHILGLDATLKGLDPGLRLPLVDLAMPMLHRMSPQQMETFRQAMKTLAETDGRLNFFEFAIGLIIAVRLDGQTKKPGGRYGFKSIEPLMDDAAALISKLALEGHHDPAHAQKAFAAAMGQIPGNRAETLSMSDPSFSTVEIAISRLAAATPGVKKTILDACAHCVLFDRTVSIEETEMLRAVAYALELPLPPFLMNRPER